MFSSRPDTKSPVSKLKCLRYEKWIQGKARKIWQFDLWCISIYSNLGIQIQDLFTSRQLNQSINQDSDKLLSDETHAR